MFYKENFGPEELFCNSPGNFIFCFNRVEPLIEAFKYIKRMDFYDAPNYEKIINYLRQTIVELNPEF